MQTIDENTNRADLEAAIIENDILPVNTAEDCARVSAMSTEELRAAVMNWIAAGDETANA